MSSIVRPLAENVRMTFGRRVHTLQRIDKAWTSGSTTRLREGPFAAVAVAVPAPEAQFLLGRLPELADPLDRVRMQPCWALMVRLDQRILPEQDVYLGHVADRPLGLAQQLQARPQCRGGDHIVVHAAPAWTRQTEDMEPEAVAEELWAEVSHVLSLPPVRPAQMVAHLWRHGLVDTPLGETFLFSREHMVGVAGDWCRGRLAEHAFESGACLGQAIVDALT